MNLSYFYDQIYHDAPALFATTFTPGSPRTKETQIHAWWKISVKNETKLYEIQLRMWSWDKKYFKLYRQILLKALMNVAINFVHFASMKVSEMKPKCWFYCLKGPFSYHQPKLMKYLMKLCQWFSQRRWYSMKFSKIFWSFTALVYAW